MDGDEQQKRPSRVGKASCAYVGAYLYIYHCSTNAKAFPCATMQQHMHIQHAIIEGIDRCWVLALWMCVVFIQ